MMTGLKFQVIQKQTAVIGQSMKFGSGSPWIRSTHNIRDMFLLNNNIDVFLQALKKSLCLKQKSIQNIKDLGM